jgi:hypothetical protein
VAEALYFLNDVGPETLAIEFEPIATPWAEAYWCVGLFFEKTGSGGMAVGRFGWEQVGNEWYILVDGVDISQVSSGTAYYRRTVQWQTKPIDVVQRNGIPWLHVTVDQNVLPSGIAITFYMDLNMVDSSVVRVPTTGEVIVRIG